MGKRYTQRAKKLMCDSPRLVDFAVGLVDLILHLPDRQVEVLGDFLGKKFNSWYLREFFRASEITSGLVYPGYFGQAGKLNFFVRCTRDRQSLG